MKLPILLTISILLIGCSLNEHKPVPSKIIVDTIYVYPDCKNPPKRTKVALLPISWGYLFDADGDIAYTLTPKGYENLSNNTSEIIRGAKELRSEIAYYKECIKAPKND